MARRLLNGRSHPRRWGHDALSRKEQSQSVVRVGAVSDRESLDRFGLREPSHK
jgi:hypothetical protein